MTWRRKVLWSEGMFLQPQHFQQEGRYLERLVDARAQCASPHLWGFTELVIDSSLLAIGRLGIQRAAGVLPDGTPFSMPDIDELPAPIDIAADAGNEMFYLAVPLSGEGRAEFDYAQDERAQWARFRAVDYEARNHVDPSDEPAPIQVGRLDARLLRARGMADGHALLGVALVVERRADQQVVLDPGYIAPQVRLAATGHLAREATLLHGLVQQRATAMAARMGQLSHGVSEVADFMMLQVLNRSEPLLREHALAPVAHPNQFFRDCLQLCGELSTFLTTQRRCPELPLYRHDDLRGCFRPLLERLRDMLSTVLEQNALQIELVDRTYGVRTAVIADRELVRSASFVLAANAQMPAEQMRQLFAAQTKVGPVDRIRELVNLQLPGIGLRNLPVAPRQIPFHNGFFYFELEKSSDLWRALEANGNLALHVAGEFPGLELELWAIRR